MKKCFLISAIALIVATKAMACGGEYVTHNWYMFSMYPHYGGTPAYEKQMEQFWRDYSNNRDDYFWFSYNRIKEAADKKGDSEMSTYLDKLNEYLKICEQLRDTWTYPTEQQLNERRQILTRLASSADTYKGTRLRAQYLLLSMRANMVLGRYDVNKKLWQNTGSKMAASPFREKMRNIYANALLNTGQRQQAWDIYAEQGDVESLRWSVHKFRDIAGIQTIAKENPNAPTLRYLVQSFVNDAQETLDYGENADLEFLKEMGTRLVATQEVKQFIAFADQLVSSGQTREPALWKSATAMLHHLLKNDTKALSDAEAAISLAGTDRMHDNARCIRLLVAANGAVGSAQLPDMLVRELQWLDAKIDQQGEDDCYYNNVKDRVFTQTLYNRYKREGQDNMAVAMFAMADAGTYHGYWYEDRKSKEIIPAGYSTEYFYELEKLSVDQLKGYFDFISSNQTSNSFESYVKSHTYRNANYFNDLIGTRLLAQGKFSEAISYLEKVSHDFIAHQNIAWYMENRDFTKPAWIVNQRTTDEYSADDDYQARITTNKKIDFCREVLQLRDVLPLQSGEKRLQTAYKLATVLFQGSHKGDCWFLGQYGSCNCPLDNDLEEGRYDLVEEAIKYLQMTSKSTDFNMQQESIYALAYIPVDDWAEYEYMTETYKPLPKSRRYAALAQLDQFAKKNSSRVARYISKCDVLKQFRALQ